MESYLFNRIITKSLTVTNSDERIFEGIATVEQLDKQGEVTIRDELLKALPFWMMRGGNLMDTHTNRNVGKGLNFAPVDVVAPDGQIYKGIKIMGMIYKQTPYDDIIWKKIVDGEYKGLSYGGATRSERQPITLKDGTRAWALKDLDVGEISVCEEPAAPFAIITDFNTLAKSYSKEEIEKMTVLGREDGKLTIKCQGSKCYVGDGTSLNKGFVEKSSNNMADESKDDKKEEQTKESKDEEKSKKTMKADDDDKDDKKDDEKEEAEKSAFEAIGKLTSVVTKFVEKSNDDYGKVMKAIDEINAKIAKGNEPAHPAENIPNGSEKVLPSGHKDGYVANSSQGGSEPQDDQAKDQVKIEEKSQQIEVQVGKSVQKSVGSTGDPSRPQGGEGITVGGKWTMKASTVLDMMRELPYEKRTQMTIAAIHNGDFGSMNDSNPFPSVM